jgi:hypothetical protein
MAEQMKQLFCVVLLFAATASIASARIGEGDAEVSARYGKSVGDIPTQAFGKVRGFTWSGYVVGVAFVSGVSNMEMFAKTDQSEMTATEIQNLLKTAGAEEWKAEPTGKPNWRRWREDDAGLVAVYDAKRHFLYINSKQFYEDQGKKIEIGEPPKKEETPPLFFGTIPGFDQSVVRKSRVVADGQDVGTGLG